MRMNKMTNWNKFFNKEKITIADFDIHESWKPIFNKYEKEINDTLNKVYHTKENIYPMPDKIFNAFNKTPLDNVKVILLGQDPYHNVIASYKNNKDKKNKKAEKNEEDEKDNDSWNNIFDKIPQAMGLSFSVNDGVKIPSSLTNIYKNMLVNNIIKEYPTSGDLTYLSEQGILLINSSLTVEHNKPGSHMKLWKPIINKILKEICNNCNEKLKKNISAKIAFIVLGKFAYEMCKELFVNEKIIFLISSHPSGLSYTKRLNGIGKVYQSFEESNHFGFIKKYFGINFD